MNEPVLCLMLVPSAYFGMVKSVYGLRGVIKTGPGAVF